MYLIYKWYYIIVISNTDSRSVFAKENFITLQTIFVYCLKMFPLPIKALTWRSNALNKFSSKFILQKATEKLKPFHYSSHVYFLSKYFIKIVYFFSEKRNWMFFQSKCILFILKIILGFLSLQGKNSNCISMHIKKIWVVCSLLFYLIFSIYLNLDKNLDKNFKTKVKILPKIMS